jgi:hypothetical protein
MCLSHLRMGLKILSLLDVDNLHSQQITKVISGYPVLWNRRRYKCRFMGPNKSSALHAVLLGHVAVSLDSPSNKC